jgi:putative Mg2+ transporter-C (MgtC) family protein
LAGPELPLEEAIARLLLVLVLAGAVGIERELREQEAGLRTHMLVGVGAALFVITGNFAWSELAFGNSTGVVLDPSRVVAYVVTGVGFLGAGAILKNGGSIRGLTTAASLWVVAAVGVSVGAGLYALGIVATAIVLLSLWPVRRLADLLGLRSKGPVTLYVDLERGAGVGDVIRLLEEIGAEVVSTSVSEQDEGRRLVVGLAGRDVELGAILDRMSGADEVRSASIDTS